MDISEVKQFINDYLRQKPHYSGDIEETNNGFHITINKHTYSKPRPERNNEEIELHFQTITHQNLVNLTPKRLQEIIEALMDEFSKN